MFIHQVFLSAYSAQWPMDGSVTIKDDTTKLEVRFTPDEVAQIAVIAEVAYQRYQTVLIANLVKPLETYQLPAPVSIEDPTVEDADFDEVSF